MNLSKIAVAVISAGQCFVIDMRYERIQRDELVDVSGENSEVPEGTAQVMQQKYATPSPSTIQFPNS